MTTLLEGQIPRSVSSPLRDEATAFTTMTPTAYSDVASPAGRILFATDDEASPRSSTLLEGLSRFLFFLNDVDHTLLAVDLVSLNSKFIAVRHSQTVGDWTERVEQAFANDTQPKEEPTTDLAAHVTAISISQLRACIASAFFARPDDLSLQFRALVLPSDGTLGDLMVSYGLPILTHPDGLLFNVRILPSLFATSLTPPPPSHYNPYLGAPPAKMAPCAACDAGLRQLNALRYARNVVDRECALRKHLAVSPATSLNSNRSSGLHRRNSTKAIFQFCHEVLRTQGSAWRLVVPETGYSTLVDL